MGHALKKGIWHMGKKRDPYPFCVIRKNKKIKKTGTENEYELGNF